VCIVAAIDNATTSRQAGWSAARSWLGGFADAIRRLGHRNSATHIESREGNQDIVCVV
jgi:hypothetical protein